MSYAFVDRILEIRQAPGGEDATTAIAVSGLKVVSRCDPFLRPGPDGAPELSPCFAGEAVGQLAAWAAMARAGFARRPVAGLTAEARVEGSARPGDAIHLRAEIESVEEDAVHYHGSASVDGREILALRDVVGPMLPMEDFDDPREVEREFKLLCAGNMTEGSSEPVHAGDRPRIRSTTSESGVGPQHPAIDRILEKGDDHIAAVTCVSRAAPYLVAHFPRKPVLPATFLLDGQVWLAMVLAGGERGPRGTRVSRIADIKMRDFLRPGARVISEVRIRDRGAERIVLDLRARSEGKTVSTGTLELVRAAEEEA